MNYGIIAAGEGSRLVDEGIETPKPLVRINGRPMIARLIDLFARCDAQSISVIVNEQMVEVMRFLRDYRDNLNIPLNIVVKTTPSSMHSFYQLGLLLKGHGRFVVTTVDTIFREEDFERYIANYSELPASEAGLMAVTTHIDDEKPLYVETDSDMNIVGFKDSAFPGSKYVSGGIYGLDDRALCVLDRCLSEGVHRMRNFQRELVAEGLRLKACDMGEILDVDHADDIKKAEKFLAK